MNVLLKELSNGELVEFNVVLCKLLASCEELLTKINTDKDILNKYPMEDFINAVKIRHGLEIVFSTIQDELKARE